MAPLPLRPTFRAIEPTQSANSICLGSFGLAFSGGEMPPVFHATAEQGICKWLLMREAPREALAEPFCKPSEFLPRTTYRRNREKILNFFGVPINQGETYDETANS